MVKNGHLFQRVTFVVALAAIKCGRAKDSPSTGAATGGGSSGGSGDVAPGDGGTYMNTGGIGVRTGGAGAEEDHQDQGLRAVENGAIEDRFAPSDRR
ncbi:MAG: hypothetical protein ABJA82_04095 [Myxococcales bacterium]